MGLKERTAARRKKLVAHVSHGFAEAEQWDLDYWQRMSPEDRLSALVAIRRDVEKVLRARADADNADKAGS